MSFTKTDILTEVEFTEIIQISHIQTKLKKNFQAIVQQLRRKSETDSKQNENIIKLFQEIKNINIILKSRNNEYVTKDELNNLKDELLKEIYNKNKKLQNEMQSKTQKDKNQLLSQINNLREQINQIQKNDQDTKNLLQLMQSQVTKLNDSKFKPSSSDSNRQKDKDDPRFDMLRKQLEIIKQQNKQKDNILQTHTKQIWDINDKLFNLENMNNELKQQLNQNQDEFEKMINKLKQYKDLDKRVEKLEKEMIDVLTQLEMLNKSIKDIESELEDVHLNISKNNFTSINQTMPNDEEHTNKQNQNLRKQLLNKLNEQRKEYLSLFKNLKDMIPQNHNNGSQERQQQFESSIGELKFLIAKKADEETSKKAVLFLEKKINYIFNTFVNSSESDARIAKTNWFCLSCDRNLSTFTGKIGEHIVHDGMKGKKLQVQFTTQKGISLDTTPNMRYKSKSKLELPTVKTGLLSTTAKKIS